MICPKCGNKIRNEDSKCPFCETKTINITNASNQKAKEFLKAGKSDDVVMSINMPKDVSKKKLLLFSIFFGWLGVHCFYVGRTKRGIIIPLLFLFCVTCFCIPTNWFLHDLLGGFVAGGFGFIGLVCWWMDILRVIFNRFPVPVVLDNY